MQLIALLRGVTPVGKNKIPKMSYLVEILEEAGFQQVRTYIQSGNIILETELSVEETRAKIHQTIKEKIGADLSIIIKEKVDFKAAIKEKPFDDSFDYSRIHLVFTNDEIPQDRLNVVMNTDFFNEIFRKGNHCLYMYLPRDASKKKLNTNFLEKQLNITATMRKINVVQHLYDIADKK
ncbi:DUF1697 domain-containing protein [Vagococcus sp.]|uniref:DUF1697 domain-containing protein n=1 Tax=Vagococcus sp. TaxID=1933889 RepID=UPI002FCACFF9